MAAGDNDALSSPGAKRTGAAASAVASPQAQKSSKKTALGGKIETLANQRAVPITTRDQVRGRHLPSCWSPGQSPMLRFTAFLYIGNM